MPNVVLAEEDEFNHLATTVDLTLKQICILRAYCKALKQMELNDSLLEAAQSLGIHSDFAKAFCEAFARRFDPCMQNDPLSSAESAHFLSSSRGAVSDTVIQENTWIATLLRRARHDEKLRNNLLFRQLSNLLVATVRTNFYQHEVNSLSLKFSSQQIEGLVEPKPLYEAFVYSPRVEGCHLRSALVSRGGVRWSARLDNYRSEVLQLMKTQTLKNAIIVPSGAKGGFICKQFEKLKAEGATSERLYQEVRDCYEIFIRGLLDLTDNPPHEQKTVCHDNNDPYLVVAADKGTGSFSDFANAIAKEYGFWLGDAFASGGSKGYDHKKMAITARGAWISVQRHFYELGVDCQTQPITVVGVGDMSGDVFGNGMLQSQNLHLVGAFDHRHIFLDPNPDPLTAYNERLRLYNLPNSSWADYNPDCLSEGGGVFNRSLEMIPLSKAICQALNIDISLNQIAPNQLITHLLKAPVDLLWFGGVGTFVKSSQETQLQVQDVLNDTVRINANQIQARVIGEGANLGMTQQARIEYAQKEGRLNTDAIDNSAGVDCSDREVNLKILFLSSDSPNRDNLLSQAALEIAAKVLTDNSAQTLILSLETHKLKNDQAIQEDLSKYQQLIQISDQQADLHFNPPLEMLPTMEGFQNRICKAQPLTRPERAVVMAYAKIYLSKQFLKAFQQDPSLAVSLEGEYISYFPALIVSEFKQQADDHPLKLEILSTILSNKIVNIMGPCWCIQTAQIQKVAEIEVALKFLQIFKSYENEWQSLAKATFTPFPSASYNSLIKLQKKIANALN